MCLTSQAVRGIWIVGCGCSSGKSYQRIWTCLTGEVESPSSPIRRQAPDVKYPKKVERRSNRIPDVRYPEKVERGPDRILPRVEWAMSRVTRGTVCMCKGERVTWHFFREDPTSKTSRKSKSNRSLKTLGDLKENEAKRYFQQLVNVLDYCHSEACTI